MPGRPTLKALAAFAALCTLCAGAAAQVPAVRGHEPANACGPIYIRHYGPHDYRTERASIRVVEEFHFTPEIEAGLRGRNGPIGGDIDYTLKASPNHHRALVTLSRLTTRLKTERLPGMEWPVECYFDRAIRYRPDDAVVYMLYAQYLHQRQRTSDAIRQLENALRHAGDNAFTHYNIGLVYLELGQPASALSQAHKAMAMGFPRTELADQLKRLGQWREPEPEATYGTGGNPSGPPPSAGQSTLGTVPPPPASGR